MTIKNNEGIALGQVPEVPYALFFEKVSKLLHNPAYQVVRL